MITGYDIQNAYIEFYTHMRKYIWNAEVVSDIVELEIESFRAFPDKAKLLKLLFNLQYDIAEVINEDDDLQISFNKFKSILEDADDIYTNLETFKEVVVL